MENKVLKKIIIFVTVFMLVFSNCGYTLQALATTDGITLFGFDIFGTANMDFEAYFLDENGKKQKENISDVNGQTTMVLELTPKAKGYLKNGTIKAVSEEEGEINFKFDSVLVDNTEESLTISTPVDKPLLKSEIVVDSENKTEENKSNDHENSLVENTAVESTPKENSVSDNQVADNTTTNESVENKTVDNTVVDNTTSENTVNTTDNTVTEENVVNENKTEEVEETVAEQEELVDEELALTEEAVKEESSMANLTKAVVVSDDEIEIENVIENTKIFVNISFKANEKLNIEDLYKAIKLDFNGTYINENLEEVPISISENLSVGWSYTKDIEALSEYTKVSPFRIGDTEGTIVEDTITIRRDVIEDKYLPLKETKITLEVPLLDGKLPTDLDVSAQKLKATNGEDINEVMFSKENWEYDENKNTLNITVENKDGTFTYGEDIYVVTYRYDSYVKDAEVSLETKGIVEVTEYSAKENNTIVKNLEKTEKVVANVGELITYSIGTTEEKIGKGKINANYNSEEEKYESEFETTVNVNILTNDVLSEFVLKDTKEFYMNKDGIEFETTDVKYKNIKFRYFEIQEFLEKGGTIEIKNNNGELLYTLNNDLIKNDEDAEISIEGDVRGLEISFKNIAVNGNIGIEFKKAIGKSSFDKSAFATFSKLESRINAEVKYSEDSDGTALQEIKTEKEFEDSKTEAEITMNKICLSTTEVNENVEFKIELNNDKENSDLYVNPIFEIALPKYVSNIDLKAVNILYNSGLTVGNTTTYRAEDGSLRMRIEVNGTQTEFSDGEMSNGTNIIVNANITIDEYTPRKDDQVKLYYINSGVTNYASQTKWTLGVDVPSGIIKQTNGFDSYVFKFNAPTGFITINEIQNYDGENGLVTSIKQGEEVREVAMEKDVQVARMNLIAINNTENKCTDVTFLGRVPAKGGTNIKTGELLETNVDAIMLNRITEGEDNPLSAKIYYSSNPDADKNLDNAENGWTETPENLSSIRSFLIIPDNTIEPGYAFRYTYEFTIPENLPYEAKIYGSFGAFYNNHSDIAITYEASSADLVGLVTQAGPKVEAKLSVDIGDGASILSRRRMKYTIAVVNSGSVEARDITISAPIPKYTTYTEKNKPSKYGDYGFSETPGKEELTFNIDLLNPGEVKEFSYYVTTSCKPTLEEYAEGKDDKGYYIEEITGYKEVKIQLEPEEENGQLIEAEAEEGTIQEPIYEKKYITAVPEVYITNHAHVNVPLLATEIETNEVKNELKYANFSSSIRLDYERTLIAGLESNFELTVQNISGETLNNVKAVFNAGKIYQYDSSSINGEENKATFDEAEGKIYFELGNLESNEIKTINLKVIVRKIESGKEENDCYFELFADGKDKEISTSIPQTVNKAILSAQEATILVPKEIYENDTLTISTQVSNIGGTTCLEGGFSFEVSDGVEVESVSCSQNGSLSIDNNGNKATGKLPRIEPEESIIFDIVLRAKNLPGSEPTKVILNRSVSNAEQDTINIPQIDFTVINSVKTEDEIEEERVDKLNKEREAQKAEEERKAAEEAKNKAQNNNNTKDSASNQANNTTSSATNNNESNNNENQANNNDSRTPTIDPNSVPENQPEVQEKPTYSISGIAWIDENRNGSREDEEKALSGAKAYLLTANKTMIKSTTMSKDGRYTFSSVENGKYIVAFSFDQKLYVVTTYKKSDVSEDRNSDVIAASSNEIGAITNEINVQDADIENIDIGVQSKDKFDLEISKLIKSIKVTTKKDTKTYNYNNEDLAKVEIPAKYIKGAKVELEYAIVIKNVGSITGYAEKVVDYLNSDLEFDESLNSSWYKGTDGYVYAKNLDGLELKPNESTELKLVLSKTMTEENTGTISNKVSILSTYNQSGVTEEDNNNSSVQSTLISISTGGIMQNVLTTTITFILLVIISYIVYYKKTGRQLFKIKLKKVYK